MSKNRAASIRTRLKNRSDTAKQDFNLTLTHYGLERLLYRLSVSRHAPNFLLKGALLFKLWYDVPHRLTRDADLLGFGPDDVESVAAVFRDVCVINVDDGIAFEAGSVKTAEIRKEARYGGVRVELRATLDGAQLSLQVDVGFGDVVTRDPFFLLGRSDAANLAHFGLADLAQLRLGTVSEVPTPWHCLRADLEDAGVDTEAMHAAGRLVTDLSMAQQMQALQLKVSTDGKAGGLDVAQVLEPFVSAALADNTGRLLYTAASRGPTVYTTFIGSRDSLARQGEAFAAITRALARLQHWMVEQGPDELARVTAPFFPDVPAAHFYAAIGRYYRDGIWAQETTVSRPGFERLAQSLHEGGFIKTRGTYAECIHNFDGAARV